MTPPPGQDQTESPPDEEAASSFWGNLKLVWRLRHHYTPYILPAAGLLLLAVAQGDLALTATTAGQRIIDRFAAASGAPPQNFGGSVTPSEQIFNLLARGGSALRLALLMALFLVLAQGLGILIGQIRTLLNERFRLHLQKNIVSSLATELAGTRAQRSTGNTAQIFTTDVAQVGGLLIFGLVGALENIIKLGIYAYGLTRISEGWVIVAVALPATLIFQTAVARLFISRETRAIERSERLNVRLRSLSTEFFDVLSRLVYFRGERSQADRLLELSRKSAKASRDFQLVSAVQGSVLGIVTTLSLPLVVALLSLPIFAAALGTSGNISAGVIVQAQALLVLLTSSTALLVSIPSMLAQSMPSVRRVEEVLQIPPPEPRPSELDKLRSGTTPPAVRVENLSFTYPGSAQQVLNGVSFEIPSGKRVALVGGSGGGKSTLARLLLGDQRPTGGTIRCDDVDITDWHVWWKRELIGFLPAEQGFLRGTLEENVLFGRPRESARNYERALEVSGAAAIARRKQDQGGMQFMIDAKVEDLLSSGERRRIGIARLLIGDQPILIFDEPGAGLDQQEMGRIARDLVAATAGTTSIIITHDPDVFITDFVIYLLNGTIGGVGPHEELFARNADYRRQLERFVAEREEAPLAAPPLPPTLKDKPKSGSKVKIRLEDMPEGD
jgi:ATP-binding cassette, subfamily B, bacterial